MIVVDSFKGTDIFIARVADYNIIIMSVDEIKVNNLSLFSVLQKVPNFQNKA